jgi:hypothetical protein
MKTYRPDDNPYRPPDVACEPASAGRSKRWFGVVALFIVGLFSVVLFLPGLHSGKGVGDANLQVVFVVTDEATNEPLASEWLELEEVLEGSDPAHAPAKVKLQTDSQGVASHTFMNTMFCNEEFFGWEVDYSVATPWWKLSIDSKEYEPLQSPELPIFLASLTPRPRAEHVGFKQARLAVPVKLKKSQ